MVREKASRFHHLLPHALSRLCRRADRLPAAAFWPFVKRFHAPARRVFAATASLADELSARGIGPVHRWSRGVDLRRFDGRHPPHPAMADVPRPVMLNVGRVAVEKNIAAFLDCDVPGTKVVVGDGPMLEQYRRRYPDVLFLGRLEGEALVAAYSAADVFVFPSRTDTFGLVAIEALACGVPVAAYPVPGPGDIVGPAHRGMHGGARPIGALHEDLGIAIREALRADPIDCMAEASHYRWASCTRQFLDGLADRSAEFVTPGVAPLVARRAPTSPALPFMIASSGQDVGAEKAAQ